ncbi:D-alanine--D-alanine ligase family protein [Rudaeicoccus suwonensis]|uniref:D-alanine--D-alanine ligase n=1 Tax=Rudaeicoccus suwonensis TaxID=657409 RepID=A0A561E9C9_9MICO|nr:D-alanine--D-alanine ligase family protein [Rudaeicoccus suwonensis]TWE12224.1 D-alanine--D-alanine ligase [Rudaeicoccus suwonensis]
MSTPSPSEESGETGRKPVVAIVFGGRSSEHAVSCSTAASVLAAIDRDRFDVVPIGISREGRWVLMADDPAPLRLTSGHTPSVEGETAALISADPSTREVIISPPGEAPRVLTEVDVVLPLLHGPFGEDGTLQGLLELGDVRYVGSGVAASAVMMDKALMKLVFASAGLPIGRYVVITDKEWRRDKATCLDAAVPLGLPVFVKPARAGSSVGVVKVDDPAELEAAIERARLSDPKVLVEAAIAGREVECGVLEGHDAEAPRASAIGEITVTGDRHTFYDFEAKYLDDDARLTCPAQLPEEDADEIRELSVKAFEAAGCEGLARVDWFYEPGGQLVLNEINTMPGFTPSSMFPRVWAETGLDYSELITELIELALNRRVGLR